MIRKLYKTKEFNLIVVITIMGMGLLYNPLKVSATENVDDPIIVVSLGDSYSSGEGVIDKYGTSFFYGQDDSIESKVKNQDWLAHRSEKSWPGQITIEGVGTLSEHRDTNWYFVATSGATTNELFSPFGKKYDYEIDKPGLKGSEPIDPQLDVFDKIPEGTVDYVTVTIGGNDVGFADIIQTAVLDSSYLNESVNNEVMGNTGFAGLIYQVVSGNEYLIPSFLDSKFDNTWAKFEEDTKYDIKNAYLKISERAGDQAHIIVAGYPKLLNKEGKGCFFSKREAEVINANVSTFNIELEKIVDECRDKDGINISFVSVEGDYPEFDYTFEGHEAYSDDEYINRIIWFPNRSYNAITEDLVKQKVPTSDYSIHPNLDGVNVYRERVQNEINKIEEEKRTKEINFEKNPKANSQELNAKAKHFSGVILRPEDVVLKMCDAISEGDYQTAAECLDPSTEQQIGFWGGIASTLVSVFSGEYISWGQLLYDIAGAEEIDVIDCYADNITIESNMDLVNGLLPILPGVRDLLCTDADVHLKYRYKHDGEYYTYDEVYHVKRYDRAGWRIEANWSGDSDGGDENGG